jgi:hypothetical protein
MSMSRCADKRASRNNMLVLRETALALVLVTCTAVARGGAYCLGSLPYQRHQSELRSDNS